MILQVGLGNGSLAVFRRNFYSLSWDILSPQFVPLGSADTPVTSLLPVNKAGIYAACGKSVWVVDVITNEQVRSKTNLLVNICFTLLQSTPQGPMHSLLTNLFYQRNFKKNVI